MENNLRTTQTMIKPWLVMAIIMFCFTSLLIAQAPTPNFHWPLTENLNDVAGGKNGTNNGVSFQNDPVRGPVAFFSGEGFARLPSFIQGISTDITVSVWFRMDVVAPWSRIYTFGRGDLSEPKDVFMVIPVNGAGNPTRNWFRFTLSYPGNPWYDVDIDTTIVKINTNQWYYSTVVLKPDSCILYINDKVIFAESGFTRVIGTLQDTENALGKSFWPDPLWKGALSDLRVYTSALTRDQVRALYNATKPTNISDTPTVYYPPDIYGSMNKITVRLHEPYTDEMVSVYSMTGALVDKRPATEIEKVSFKPGIYLVRVLGSNVNHTSKVFVR
jgi:hypothetical protein